MTTRNRARCCTSLAAVIAWAVTAAASPAAAAATHDVAFWRADAIGAKLVTGPVVFTHGEDERLARALLSIVNRVDFDRAGFSTWLAQTKPAVAPRPTVAQLRAIQNWKNTLAKLEVVLPNDPQASDAVVAARTAVRAALKELF